MAYNYKLRVQNLIKKYGTSDPLEIAASKGIKVLAKELPHNINGLWKKVLRRKFICYNQSLEGWQVKAVVAHELGHILLHPQYKHYCTENRCYYASTRHEAEADAFAVALCSFSLPEIDIQYIFRFLQEGYK